jgi:hypothetical protein
MILWQVLQTYNYANIFILRKDRRTLKKAIKGILIFAAILVGLSLLVSLLIRLPSVQNFAIKKTASYLSKNTDARISIGSFGWNMFDDLSVRHFYLGNKNGDTIIAARSLFIDFDSWSLIKSEVKIKNILLDRATVNLQIEEDGKLNLSKLFAKSGSASIADTPGKKINTNWITVLKKIQLKNTALKIVDVNKFTTIKLELPILTVDIDNLNLREKNTKIKKVFIERPSISIMQTDTTISAPEDSNSFYFLPEGWRLSWKEFIIKDGKFKLDKSYIAEKTDLLDFNHLKVRNINTNAKSGEINRESLTLELKAFSAVEKSGFAIKNISTDLLLSLTDLKLENLKLITGNSFITESIALSYSRFNDFKEFLSKVKITASLKKSYVSLKDFSYLTKGIEPYAHNRIFIDGNIEGRISNLRAKDLVIKTAQNTVIKGDFFTSGLPDINETFLNLRIKSLNTSIADIRRIAPAAKIPDDVNKVGNLYFYGNLDGFITDFVANGNLLTDIGKASSDINFKYDTKTLVSSYSGDLNLDNFNLGKWFNDTTIGKASFSAVLNGKGLTLATLDTKIEGVIENITFKKYNYKNLIVNGRVRNRSFEGNFSVTDPNVYLSFSGKADLSDTIPVYKFNADIRNIALQELNLSKDNIRLKGSLSADFEGKTVDNIEGNIILKDIQLIRNDEIQKLQSIELISKKINNTEKILSLETDRAEAIVKGRFSLLMLPKIISSYFNKAIYQIDDLKKYPPQIFTVDIRIYDSLPALKILEPKLKLISNTFIKADINTEKETFELNGVVPILVYDNFKFKTTDLNSSIDKKRTTARITTDKVYSGDSLILDTIVLAINDVANGYKLNIQVKDNKNFNKTNSNILIFPKSNSVDLQIRNSSIWLGGKEWLNTDNNNIHLGKKIIEIANLEFHSDSQRIAVQSYYKADSLACIKTTMKETSLNGFMAIFNTKVKDIDATVNGMFKIEDIFNKPIFLGNLSFNNTKLGKVTLGNLSLTSTLNSAQNRIDLSGKLDGGQNNLAIKGYYNLDKQNQVLNLTADIANGNLDFLNYKFFERYVKKVKGDFSGKLNISGPLKKLALEGKVILNDADVTVSYLNTRYSLKNEVIEVNKDGYFDIGEILLKDTKNNLAKGSGRIYHQNLKKFRLDLRVATDNMMFLNTTAKDNAVFYGQIFGKGVVTFSGVIPTVDIRAFATITDGTHVYIPINSNVDAAGYSFYKFTNRQNDSLREVGKRDQVRFTGVNFEVDVDVNTDGIVDIILDPISGDVLSSQGHGNLKIQVLRTGEFNIYGLYEIDRGNYLFTLQNIINKRFTLNKGGTIAFNGDVYKALLNADAVYEVRTSTYDLIFDPQQTEGISAEVEARSKNRMLTRLLLKLKGSLERPDVSFDIQPMDPDPAIRTILENKMQIVKSTESELNKQVFGLLVMNRFLPTGTAVNPISNTSYISGSVTNTVSEFLSSQLSQYVSNFFETMNVKEFDVKLNFRQYDQQTSSTQQQIEQQSQFDTRRELQLALTKRFFNNRLSINVGGNLDFGDRNTFDQSAGTYRNNPNTYVTGDFQIEYAITKSGNLRAKAYNRGDYDNFNQRNRNKTGIGITFQQDFDNIYDLLRIKRKQNSIKEAEKNAAKKEEDLSPVSK